MENFSIETGILTNIKKRYFFFVNVIMLMLVDVFFLGTMVNERKSRKIPCVREEKNLEENEIYIFNTINNTA